MLNIKRLIFACTFTFLIIATSQAQEVTSPTPLTGKWRINLSGGYGLRIGSSDDPKTTFIEQGFKQSDVDDFFTDIKRGYKVAGEIHYMFWKNMGLGIDYNFLHTAGSLSGYIGNREDFQSRIVYSKIEDDVFTNYLGISFLSEDRIGQSRFKVYSQVSLGISMYREETLFNYTPMVHTGNALGVNTELGIEYPVINKMSVALSVSYFGSSISKVKVDNGYTTNTIKLPDNKRESLSRLDISLGLSYYL